MELVLASASQRRQDLLSQFGIEFQVCAAHVKEKHIGNPHDIVIDNAIGKAKAVFGVFPQSLILAADTIVVLGNEIMGKPRDKTQASAMLMNLSGRSHQVITGVALCDNRQQRFFYQVTDVYFRSLTNYEIENYIKTGEPFDKAGSYGIQGIGGAFVESISGCYYNVVGLPIPRLIVELRHFGFDVFAQRDI